MYTLIQMHTLGTHQKLFLAVTEVLLPSEHGDVTRFYITCTRTYTQTHIRNTPESLLVAVAEVLLMSDERGDVMHFVRRVATLVVDIGL